MEQPTYTTALRTIWCGLRMFFACWASTLNRLLKDLLHGIFRHWFFAIVVVAIYATMFVIMGQARSERDRGEIINYELTQQIDSLKFLKR